MSETMYLKQITDLKGCINSLERYLHHLPQTINLIQHMKTVMTFQMTEYTFYELQNTVKSTDQVSPAAMFSVCEDRIKPEYHIFFQDQASHLVKQALTTKVDWKKCNTFYALPAYQLPLITGIALSKGAKKTSEVRCNAFVLKQVSKLPESHSTIENGRFIQRLNSDAAHIINSHWKFRDEESELIIRKTLEVGLGYGVFHNDHLLSWIMLNNRGDMGYLYTLPEARRRGYSFLIVNKLSRHVLSKGLVPVVYIEIGNEASSNLFFGRLGFEQTLELTNVTFSPVQ